MKGKHPPWHAEPPSSFRWTVPRAVNDGIEATGLPGEDAPSANIFSLPEKHPQSRPFNDHNHANEASYLPQPVVRGAREALYGPLALAFLPGGLAACSRHPQTCRALGRSCHAVDASLTDGPPPRPTWTRRHLDWDRESRRMHFIRQRAAEAKGRKPVAPGSASLRRAERSRRLGRADCHRVGRGRGAKHARGLEEELTFLPLGRG